MNKNVVIRGNDVDVMNGLNLRKNQPATRNESEQSKEDDEEDEFTEREEKGKK